MGEPSPAGRRLGRALQRIGQHRDNPVVRVAAKGARALLRGVDSPPVGRHDIATNGEAAMLRRLGPSLSTVLDVGANVGEWTAAALDAGAAHVHAFEISPDTSAHLRARFAGNDRVSVNAVGLSDGPGTVTLHHFPEHPMLTTVTDYPHDAASVELQVPVRTGASYLEETGLTRVDLLKMDVEGAEPAVLRGFDDAFRRDAIGSVQFEYGRVSLLTRFLLADFYEFFVERGFALGRIETERVRWLTYSLDLETFSDSNFLAVHHSRRDLWERLEAEAPG
jgi:FkbM family methyltransferase